MALNLQPSTAKIESKSSGAIASCHIGTRFALLHCTKGANLTAGDRMPAGKVKRFDAFELEGTVFLEATADEHDIGDREFGMVQVTNLLFYEFIYAGRRASEGSCNLNLKSGFTVNPSLDVQTSTGQTIDQKIFDTGALLIDRVTTPRTGFNITVRFGDHPNNVIPYRFANTLTGASNFLAVAARAQKFMVYFFTRANATSPITVLGSFDWAVDWLVEFTWSARTTTATANIRRADVLEGAFSLGAPSASDAMATIALNRSTPTANKQDEDTVAAIFNRRRAPMLTQSRTLPNGFRTDFFK
jgi:hypothetical protein